MFDRRALIASLAALAAASAAGCTTMADGPVDRAALRDHLMAIEIASWEHTKAKAVAPMQAYLADEALLIFGDGTRVTKAQFLAMLPDFNVVSFTVEPNASVIPLGADTAILLYRVTYSSAMKNDRPTTLTALAANTYARRDGRWVSVLYQETPVR